MNIKVSFGEKSCGLVFDALSENIDDTKVSSSMGWSSKNILDKLGLRLYEKGSTVVCEPMKGTPLGLVSHIEPKQAGSGYPSPSNIRPITGYDSIKLSRTGKNLFGGEALADVLLAVGCTKDAENGIITIEPGKCDRTTPFWANFKENTQYTFIFYGRNTNANLNINHLNLCIRYTDGEEAEVWGNAPGTDQYVVVTSKAGKTVYGVQVTWHSGNTILYYDKCGVFEGAVGLEAFESYNINSNIFTAELGQTVYGGRFNWQTGVLTSKLGVFKADKDATWIYETTSNGIPYVYLPSIKIKSNSAALKCNVLSSKSSTTMSYITHSGSGATGYIQCVIHGLDIESAEEWREWTIANDMMVIYEAETPTTIQLTPQEILALSGTNYISSNTGDTEVSGTVDTSTAITNFQKRLAALEAVVVNNA